MCAYDGGECREGGAWQQRVLLYDAGHCDGWSVLGAPKVRETHFCWRKLAGSRFPGLTKTAITAWRAAAWRMTAWHTNLACGTGSRQRESAWFSKQLLYFEPCRDHAARSSFRLESRRASVKSILPSCQAAATTIPIGSLILRLVDILPRPFWSWPVPIRIRRRTPQSCTRQKPLAGTRD
jgi:hypothetical protein